MTPHQQRHGLLVDKKFTDGLSPAEAHELAQIERALDAAEAPYYAPILDALTITAPVPTVDVPTTPWPCLAPALPAVCRHAARLTEAPDALLPCEREAGHTGLHRATVNATRIVWDDQAEGWSLGPAGMVSLDPAP